MADVDENAYACGMDIHRAKWFARASDASLTLAQREYATNRVRAMTRTYASRLEACRTKVMMVDCGCKSERERPFGCRQHLVCPFCRVKRAASLTTRIREALRDKYEHARHEDPHALLVMMTIALRHTGDIAADRHELAQAWKRFRKRCQRRWGSFEFVGTFEVTPGRDGLGHVHAHMVCIWPRGKPGDATQGDWQTLQRLWVDASGVGHDGAARSERVSFRASRSARDAAGYVAKYVAKGITSAGFDAVLAAKVASGTYNTRWLVSSRGFWLPWPPVCKACGEPVGRVDTRFDWENDVGPPPPEHHDPPDWKQSTLDFPDAAWFGGHR